MSDQSLVRRQPTLAQAVDNVFSATNGLFPVAERLVELAEGMTGGPDRDELLRLAQQIGSAAKIIVSSQDDAVIALERRFKAGR